jgi:hypothetical protein
MTPAILDDALIVFEGAARASKSALPLVPKLGFFSSQKEKIEAFLTVCHHLDKLVANGSITQPEAQMAIQVMMVSSKDFDKAMREFTNWAVPKWRPFNEYTTNSITADRYLNS